MKRRTFVVALGGAVAWPAVAWAQHLIISCKMGSAACLADISPQGVNFRVWPAQSSRLCTLFMIPQPQVSRSQRAYGVPRAAAGPPTGDPRSAPGRPLTRGFRLGPLARTGGPDEHLPSTARVHRSPWRRGGLATRGARAAGRPREAHRRAHVGRRKRSSAKSEVSAFTQALADLGWTNGRNVQMHPRWAGPDNDRIRAFALELVGLQADIILTSSTPTTVALLRETRTIPIVFASVGDPVASGILSRLSRPSGNVTGSAQYEPTMGGKGLELLSEIAPGLNRAAILFNPDTAPYRLTCPHLRRQPGHSRSSQSLHPFKVA